MISKHMRLAIEKARTTMNNLEGGPFGAVIIDQNQRVLSVSSNSVLKDHDPTAHAEINAIREAGRILKTHDLSNCILYTTCYPCPMCMSAIIWANIKVIYFGASAKDAEQIGFKDDFIYRFFKKDVKDSNLLHANELNREECLKLFDEYAKKNFEIY